jgi:hypothetical protein
MTRFAQLLDPIPVGLVFVLVCVVALAMYEMGLRLGRLARQRSPEAVDSGQGQLVGALVGMLAFLLAVSMSMASDRFNTRRTIIRDEANTIETTFLRAGYLADPHKDVIRNLLREYVPLRVIQNSDLAQIEENNVRSTDLHEKLWTQTEILVRTTQDTPSLGLFIESVNELIDLHTTRVTAAIYSRVPETVLLVLLVGAVMTMGVVGYNAGLTTRGSMVTTVMLTIALGAVLTLVIDLDRPRDGFLQVSQQPLIDLRKKLSDPPH